MNNFSLMLRSLVMVIYEAIRGGPVCIFSRYVAFESQMA